MSKTPKRIRLTEKYLDPADRLGEILFEVIMVLTFTLTAGFAADKRWLGLRSFWEDDVEVKNARWFFLAWIVSVFSVRSLSNC